MSTKADSGKRFFFFAGMIILLASSNAMAQRGFGIRAGVSVDPDQFHFGGHFISDPIVSNLSFRPNLEVGVGNDITSICANLEFAFRIPVPKSQLSAYIGAGPALNVYRHGESRIQPSHTNTGGGFNLLFGLEHREGLFGELKVGTIDSPEVKITVGFTFR